MLNDTDCLIKLKQARELINSIPTTSTVDHPKQSAALVLIDAVADELEDRISKAMTKTGRTNA